LNWTQCCHYEPDAQAALHWCIHLATEKSLSPDTINQYLGHLQSFTELQLLPQIRTAASKRLIKGLRRLYTKASTLQFLFPSTVLLLFLIIRPTLMQAAILFQAFTGLRGGQMVKITPLHILNATHHIVPPYKKCKVTTMLPLDHVHPAIVLNFLAYQRSSTTPILAMTANQYKKKFKSTLAEFGYDNTSHDARRFFATYNNFLKVPIPLIGMHLIHQNALRTTPTYIYSLEAAESLVILKHPELFKPLTPSCLSPMSRLPIA